MSDQEHDQSRILLQLLRVLPENLKTIIVDRRAIERKIHRSPGLFVGKRRWFFAAVTDAISGRPRRLCL